MALADRVVLMNKGCIEQIGAPAELDDAPASPFVFEFLGEVNRLPCEIVGGQAVFEGFRAPVIGTAAGGAAVAMFRPSETRLDAGANAEGLPVRVIEPRGRGAVRSVECQALGGQRLVVDLPESHAAAFANGDRARLSAARVMIDGEGAATQLKAAEVTPLVRRGRS
jgi:sulfate transport system ATP-binding protein